MTDAKPFTDEELEEVRNRISPALGGWAPAPELRRFSPLALNEQRRLLATLEAERARREAAEWRASMVMAVLRRWCDCETYEEPPTSWGPEGPVRIPHHCDCPLYPFELPDADAAPTAHADALQTAAALCKPTDEVTR